MNKRNQEEKKSNLTSRVFVSFFVGVLASILYLALAQYSDGGSFNVNNLVLDYRHPLVGLFVVVVNFGVDFVKSKFTKPKV